MLRLMVIVLWAAVMVCPAVLDGNKRPVVHAAALAAAVWFGCWGAAALVRGWSVGVLLKRFLAASVAVGVVVGAAELAVGFGVVDFRRLLGPPVTDSWLQPHNTDHPTLLHVHRPGVRIRLTQEGGDLAQFGGVEPVRTYHHDVAYDHRGFRNPPDLHKAPVVVLGDSFVEGAEVAADALCTHRLSLELAAPVANFGQSHYGPQQALETLRLFGADCEPKVCVWVFFEGNDLWDTLRYDRTMRGWEKERHELHSFWNRSLTRNLIQRLRWWLKSRPVDGEPRVRTVLIEGRPLHFASRQNGKAISPADETALVRLGEVFEQAARFCQERGVRPVFVFNPTKYRVYGPSIRFDQEVAVPWVISDLPERIRGLVSGLPGSPAYLDLTPAMERAVASGQWPYLPDDTHWSEVGHGIFASEVAEVVRPLLK